MTEIQLIERDLRDVNTAVASGKHEKHSLQSLQTLLLEWRCVAQTG